MMPPPAHTTRGFRGSLAHLGPPVSSRGSSTGSPSGVKRAKRASCLSRAAHRAGFSGRFRAKSQQVWTVSATTSSMSRSRDAPVHSRATPSTPAPARDLRPAAPSMSTRWAPSSWNRFVRGGSCPAAEGPASWTYPSDRVRNTATGPSGVITSVRSTTSRVASHRESIPLAVANRSPRLTYRSGFSVPVTRSVPSPSRPTEVRPRHSSPSSAIRRRMAVVLPAFLHRPITVTGEASPTSGANRCFKTWPPFHAVSGCFDTAIIRAVQGFCQWGEKSPPGAGHPGRFRPCVPAVFAR